jgi:putative ABC transport system permease protein
MNFISIPFSNLLRRPMRTAFTVTGIASAIALFIVMMGLSRGVEHAYIDVLEERGIHVIAVRKGVIDILSGSIDQKRSNELLNFPGVVAVSPELIDWVMLDSGYTVVVLGWPANSFLWESLSIEPGSHPQRKNTNGVVVGKRIAQALKLKVGDQLMLHGHRCQVTGISRPGSTISSNALVLHLARLQKLTDRADKVTAFNLRVANSENESAIVAIVERLSTAFPDLSFMPTKMVGESNNMIIMLKSFSWGTSVVAVFIGILVMLNTLLMSVSERTREIGILSALGWRPTRILAMIFSEGFLIVIISLLVGICLGSLGLIFFAHSPRTSGYVDARLTLTMLLEVVVAAVMISGFGCIYPAWRAIGLHPGEALRHD